MRDKFLPASAEQLTAPWRFESSPYSLSNCFKMVAESKKATKLESAGM